MLVGANCGAHEAIRALWKMYTYKAIYSHDFYIGKIPKFLFCSINNSICHLGLAIGSFKYLDLGCMLFEPDY